MSLHRREPRPADVDRRPADSPPSAVPALELVDITKRFGDVVAVDGIDLRVERGEFFSLLGPSGCGKTTTLRMIAGFEEPTSGALYLDGVEGSRLPPFKRSTNLVFQSYALFPHMTVWDNVAYGPRRARRPRRRVDADVEAALATVKMLDHADRLPRALSGGQRQRVALARGIVNHPAVLLLDEPLGALDLKLRREMQLELKHIQREVGISFVYVTHDQEEALTLSDRIAVMNRGRVEQVGTPEEIYRRPATRFCADFIGDANLVDVDVVGGGTDGTRVVLPGGTGATVSSRAAAVDRRRGGRAVLVLRPQSLSLVPPSRAGAALAAGTALVARVREVVYQGAVLRYTLDGPEGVELTVVAATGAHEAFGPGDEAVVCWPPDGGHLVAGAANGPRALHTDEQEEH